MPYSRKYYHIYFRDKKDKAQGQLLPKVFEGVNDESWFGLKFKSSMVCLTGGCTVYMQSVYSTLYELNEENLVGLNEENLELPLISLQLFVQPSYQLSSFSYLPP